MKMEYLKKWWWAFGIAEILLAALNPYVGWFALANVIAFGAGIYVLAMAKKNKKRLTENQAEIMQMPQEARQKFYALSDQEAKSIKGLSNVMIPLLNLASLLINVYTCFYYYQTGYEMMYFYPWYGLSFLPLCLLLIAEAVCMLLYCIGFCSTLNHLFRMQPTEKGSTAQKKK